MPYSGDEKYVVPAIFIQLTLLILVSEDENEIF